MSHELLIHLADRYAFDPTPSFADLGAYHVPFDDLVGGDRVEGRLTQAVTRGERAVLIADSGSGKSTIISSVLGLAAVGVAPIVVPLRPLEDRASSPLHVADEMLGLLARYAMELDALSVSGADRRVWNRTRRSGGVRLALGWLQGDLAREVMAQVETQQTISISEKFEMLGQIVARIHAEGLMPVVVFDDTDRWLVDADTSIVDGFFHEIIRWLTELPLAVVVAAHTRYLDEPAVRRDRLEFLDTTIEIPRVPHADALVQVLDRRIELHTIDSPFAPASCADVFAAPAIDVLFEAYDNVRSLRRVIRIVHTALAEDTSAGRDTISTATVNAVCQSL